MYFSRLHFSKLYFSKLYFFKLYSSKLYFSKLYFSKLYLSKLHFSKLYYSKLYFSKCTYLAYESSELCEFIRCVSISSTYPGESVGPPVTLSDFNCFGVSGLLQSARRPRDVMYFLKSFKRVFFQTVFLQIVFFELYLQLTHLLSPLWTNSEHNTT